MNVCDRYSSSSYSQYYNIKDILKEDYIEYLLVKCNKNFVKESFKIPAMTEKYYLCKMSNPTGDTPPSAPFWLNLS